MKVFEQDPVKVYRIEDKDDIIDIYIPDILSIDSIVCIMKNGEFLPFDQWEKYEDLLEVHLDK